MTPRQIAERDRDETQRQRAIEHGMLEPFEHQIRFTDDLIFGLKYTVDVILLMCVLFAGIIYFWSQ